MIFSRNLRILYLRSPQLGPYVEGLRRLEGEIEYPIADGEDHFRIDHGEEYHRFFSEMGEAHFLVALEGEEVVGSIAGVFKPYRVGEKLRRSVYLGDLKVAKRWRGGKLGPAILRRCLMEMARNRELWKWEVAFGAGMRGAGGDFMKMAQGRPFHVARLTRPVARLALFFEPPEKLAALSEGGRELSLPGPGVDFSPGATEGKADWISTGGRKDLRLMSTGEPWPLVHLVRGPGGWRDGYGAYLRRCGESLLEERGESLACFALDERLKGHLRWLREAGMEPGAIATLHGLLRPRAMKGHRWVHLATAEI